MVHLSAVAAVAALSTLAIADPEPHRTHAQVKREIEYRNAIASKQTHSLEKCAGSEKMKRTQERTIERRAATLQRLRKERGITNSIKHRRNLDDFMAWGNVNHNETGVVAADADLFGANTSCILTPKTTIGTYFVSGEHIRVDVTEDQPGVPLHLEMQFIDTTTCEPLPEAFVDIWGCNATGVYSGIGVTTDGTVQGGFNSTFLRGVQSTNVDVIVDFDTIFPGHYLGRTTHEHVVVHVGSKALANSTSTGGTVAHIGQLYFDETLRSAVEATAPYNTNTIAVTSNNEDRFSGGQATNEYDPFVEYIYLDSSDITAGLLAWASIGVDSTADRTVNVTRAAYQDAEGGHATGEKYVSGL